MISENMKQLVKGSSVIRAMFEEGKRLSQIYGKENVYDFSLGNPSVEPPEEIKNAIKEILDKEPPTFVHGYMNNSGYEDVREAIAQSTNKEFGTNFSEKNVIMTVGAAGALNIVFKTLLNPNDEVIVFAPYFGEYNNYVNNFNGKLVIIPANTENFQPNLDLLEKSITNKTKAVIVNSPNNPSGVVYSEDTLKSLSDILNKKQKEINSPIYLISDEPYRKLAYDNVFIPYVTKYYNNTLVAYSFSKSLSLPGERIGYLIIPNEIDGLEDILAGLNVANRILGFVNSPSLFQRVAAKCIDANVDISVYDKNRTLLYDSLTSYGYSCLKPEGAFYMFIKSLEEDDKAFCEKAKKYNLLLVPGSAFSCSGFFRLAYCVSYETVKNSLESFQKLAKEYGL